MTTEAAKRANAKYKDKHRYYHLRFTPEQYEAVLTAAEAHGQTMQQYVLGAVLERVKSEKTE